jgi:hypothetical protein
LGFGVRDLMEMELEELQFWVAAAAQYLKISA